MWPNDPAGFVAWLEARFRQGRFSVAADASHNAARKAAVLIGFVLREDEITVLLTRRADHLAHHPGQISFPGGAVEPQDEDAVAAALRETHEEIGVPSQFIRPLGVLGEYHTISGFCVSPVLAVLEPNFVAMPDVNEVAEVFELPARVLLDPTRYHKRPVERAGVRGMSNFLEYDGRVVWGATAGMLLQLANALELKPIPDGVSR